MISNIGIPGLVLILVLALIIFGPKKLPELGRAVGQTAEARGVNPDTLSPARV